MIPFEKMHKHTYILIPKINYPNFSFYCAQGALLRAELWGTKGAALQGHELGAPGSSSSPHCCFCVHQCFHWVWLDWQQESQNNLQWVCSCSDSNPLQDRGGSHSSLLDASQRGARGSEVSLLGWTVSVGVYSNESDQRHQGLALYFSFEVFFQA